MALWRLGYTRSLGVMYDICEYSPLGSSVEVLAYLFLAWPSSREMITSVLLVDFFRHICTYIIRLAPLWRLHDLVLLSEIIFYSCSSIVKLFLLVSTEASYYTSDYLNNNTFRGDEVCSSSYHKKNYMYYSLKLPRIIAPWTTNIIMAVTDVYTFQP